MNLVPLESSDQLGKSDNQYAEAHVVAIYENGVRVATSNTKLDDFAVPDDTTDLDANATRHGLMPRAMWSKLDGIEPGAQVGDGDMKASTYDPGGAATDAFALGNMTGTLATPQLADNVVTNAKAADMANARIKGRATSGTGDPEDLTAAQVRTILNVENNAAADQTIAGLTGDITASALRGALNVENGASADQTGAEIVSAIDTQLGSSDWQSGGGGSGDVVGPASSGGEAIARFDGATGKLLKSSLVTIDDSGYIAGPNLSGDNTGDESAESIRFLGFFDESNDGEGSGLDADLLDGQHASAFATAAQGSLADTAVQPGDIGTAAAADADDFATAFEGDLAATAVQPGDNISSLTNDAGYTDDQTSSEIATAYQSEVPFASQGEMETGTEAAERRMSPERVAQAIAVMASGVKNDFDHDGPPTVDTDETEGWAPGSVIIDTTATPAESYRCASAATGAAVWLPTSISADDLATVAMSGLYDDLTGRPQLIGQAEAEGGTATDERLVSGQRIGQAIAALAPAETASSIRGLGFFDTSNDGTGSGLDADLLDGQHASDFATAAQGGLADTALQPASSIFDLADVDEDGGAVLGDFLLFSSGAFRPFSFEAVLAPFLPVGTVLPYAGSSAPAGFDFCDGSTRMRSGPHSDLFAVIGTTYGAGDGSTTFNLPDLRGRVVAGKDNMGGTGANRLTSGSAAGIDGDTLGASGGEEEHTQTQAEMPTHNHSYVRTNNQGIQVGGGGGSTGVFSSSTGNRGDGEAMNNTQPTLVLNYIIKA